MKTKHRIDWFITIVPFFAVLIIAMLFFVLPGTSTKVLSSLRNLVGNKFGLIFLLFGLVSFFVTMYMAFSKIGRLHLGKVDKPQFSSFTWGTMVFTSTMAADVLFYSLIEWALYGNESYVQGQGLQRWALSYSLFHWGPIAWSFYLVLAVAFAYMIHVKGRTQQKFSEACRRLLGDKVDGPIGTLINFIAIFALLCGTATTFSLTTPLIAKIFAGMFNMKATVWLSMVILIVIALLYTLNVLFGLKGVARAAKYCTYLFMALLFYVVAFGGQFRFIFENGFSALGNLGQNFIGMATWTDPMRTSSFPQKWTIYYWAYWMVWSVATPFFIAKISRGRTIKSLVLGGYFWGLAGTFVSFIVLGGYGLALQFTNKLDTIGFIAKGGSYSVAILRIFRTLPLSWLGLILLAVTMVFFYIAVFDSITMVVSTYSYKSLPFDEEPDKHIRVLWAIIFIVLPLALIFNQESLASLQSVSIVAALPLGIVMCLVVASFFKDVKEGLSH